MEKLIAICGGACEPASVECGGTVERNDVNVLELCTVVRSACVRTSGDAGQAARAKEPSSERSEFRNDMLDDDCGCEC